jgi:hypothetical protein
MFTFKIANPETSWVCEIEFIKTNMLTHYLIGGKVWNSHSVGPK